MHIIILKWTIRSNFNTGFLKSQAIVSVKFNASEAFLYLVMAFLVIFNIIVIWGVAVVAFTHLCKCVCVQVSTYVTASSPK